MELCSLISHEFAKRRRGGNAIRVSVMTTAHNGYNDFELLKVGTDYVEVRGEPTSFYLSLCHVVGFRFLDPEDAAG